MLRLRDIPLLAPGLLQSMMCWRPEGPGWGGGGPGKCRDARQLQVTWGVFEQMESRSAFVGVSERSDSTGNFFDDPQMHGVLAPQTRGSSLETQ